MMSIPKIIFIGAGSTIFVKDISGDVPHREALKAAYIALMDIDLTRLEGSHIVVCKPMDPAGASDRIICHTQQREALQDTDFVMMVFQVGGYEPCTVTDLEVYKRHGSERTVADILESDGIMHALCTIPRLWQICKDMTEVCLDTAIFSYVNLMAMSIWAIYVRYPYTRQVGLYHSVQGTVEELTRDFNVDPAMLRYHYVGINCMAFYLELERKTVGGSYVNLYPELLTAYEAGQTPKSSIHDNTRCQSIVRYEIFRKLGYFVIESSEHFAEYAPWPTKPGCEDLIECYKVLLDEYPKRCIEQLASWHKELEEYKNTFRTGIRLPRGYAGTIINVVWTGESNVIYGNVRNDGLIDNLSQGCCVEVACLVDANGIQSTKTGTPPSHLAALMQTNVSVQTLLTEVILTGNRNRVCYVAMMNPHTVAVLGIGEIYAPIDDPTAAHGDWLPGRLHR